MYTYLNAYKTYTAERPFDKQNLLHKFYEFKTNFDKIIKKSMLEYVIYMYIAYLNV